MEIEYAELELHPRQVRVVVEHALERADRGLVVAEVGFELGVAKPGIEIVRLDEQALEQEIGDDALVYSRRGARRNRRSRLRRGGLRLRSPRSGQRKGEAAQSRGRPERPSLGETCSAVLQGLDRFEPHGRRPPAASPLLERTLWRNASQSVWFSSQGDALVHGLQRQASRWTSLWQVGGSSGSSGGSAIRLSRF